MGKCKFQEQWLLKTDVLGFKISVWCRKESSEEIFCTVCNTSVKVAKGYQSIEQHVVTKKHKINVQTKHGIQQLHFTATPAPSAATLSVQNTTTPVKTSAPGTIRLYSALDNATTAELIWTMKNVACNMSAASCYHIADTFKAMFPGAIPDKFSLSPAKLGYLITEALGPYFRNSLIEDVKKSFCLALCFDETTNNEDKKELQTLVRFWSELEDEVVTKHLETFFLGQAKGEDLAKHLCLALNNADIPLSKLLMIGSDGPNVNKKVMRIMKEEVAKASAGSSRLLDIGFCNIHTIHNAFLRGLEQLGSSVSDVIISIYHFFHGWPSRWEDFDKIQEELGLVHHRFLKHVSTRWLTIEPAAVRLLEQYAAVEKYFLKFVPQKKADLINNTNYSKIVLNLKVPTFKASIHFVLSSAHMFTRITGFFQRSEPLIHILYSELETLACTIVGRVCKPQLLQNKNLLKDSSTIFESCNLLRLQDVVISDEVKQSLQGVTEKTRLEFMDNVKQHYIASCKHILAITPLCNIPFLKNFRFLKPEERLSQSSCQNIKTVARNLKFEVPIEMDVLQDEWRQLQLEEAPASTTADGKNIRIDHYWRHYFKLKDVNNSFKYPTVTKVVKSCLTLCHGNADIERSFSRSARVLTEEKASMSIRMLNARLFISEGLKKYHNQPERVPITKELLTLARGAYASYQAYLEEQLANKKKKIEEEREKGERAQREKERLQELESRNASIKKLEESYKKARDVCTDKLDTSEKLLQEANKKLKTAVKSNDLSGIKVAQAMLDSVEKMQKEEATERKEADKIERKINKRKSTFISSFFDKKAKKNE